MTTFRVRQIQRRLEWLGSQKFTTLRIDVPKNNEKTPLAAEQMFASIHGIYSDSSLYQNHISFEIVARDKFIQFYVTVPNHIKDFVEGQIYAQYPTVEINEVPDYTQEIKAHSVNFAVSELGLNKPDVYPIRFFESFEVDPLSAITSVMSKLGVGEEVWFQILMRPVGDSWQDKGNSIVGSVRAGKKQGGPGLAESIFGGIKHFFKLFISQAINPGGEVTAEKTELKLPSSVEDALKGIEQKITKLGFETKIRILCIANDPVTAAVKCQTVAAAFKQFNTTNLNGFKLGEPQKNNHEYWQAFVGREFVESGNIFNIAELASIYHLPNQSVETPNIVWSGSKKGEPPANLPLVENTPSSDLTIIGLTNFRNVYREFGIKIDDRKRHIYMIGKSGVGKSVLMENMAIDDVISGRGVIVVDPHGEFADKILACVPDERMNDVIVFDPADRGYPIAFNLLEMVDEDFKGMVASGFVGIFKKIFGDSWGPRLEHILRNTILALLDNENSTMLDIPRMLTDNRFRDRIVEKVKDPVIRDFWVNEFAQYDTKFRTEAVSPILNKVGQFLATATIRNIVGQPVSKINIREIMDQQKILIVNLSRGKIGEDNSALLGAMIITKIQLSAMSRADVTVDKRPECFLYVDEFQNFATESFSVILAEARKYNLSLTMANQYIEQLSEEVKSAVFGNAGTIISFRVGGTDAAFLVREFEPVFDANDMVNLDKFNIYIKLLVNGTSAPAFSAKTLPPVQKLTGNTEKIINLSHQKYSSQRAYVEEQIANRNKEEDQELRDEAEAFKQGGLGALLTKRNGVVPSSEHTKTAGPVNYNHLYKPAETTANLEPVKTEAITKSPLEPANEAEKIISVVGESSIQQNSNIENSDIAEKTERKDKPRLFKYQNIIGDTLYKEQTARGGVKWYIGEDIDTAKYEGLGVEITEEAKKMINLAKKVSGQGSANPHSEEPRLKQEEKKEPIAKMSEPKTEVTSTTDQPVESEKKMIVKDEPVTNKENDRSLNTTAEENKSSEAGESALKNIENAIKDKPENILSTPVEAKPGEIVSSSMETHGISDLILPEHSQLVENISHSDDTNSQQKESAKEPDEESTAFNSSAIPLKHGHLTEGEEIRLQDE